ncbi:MAG: HU family DNA-binding protein [Puniceicoccales bacterium]|jgi:DNA-binding protein HU-beta|nr:HU family DNA-binding protein [Puniceicoccales bacterium]
MKKSDLIAKAYSILLKDSPSLEKENINKSSTERIVNALLSAISEGLKTDEEVQIIGFGTFSVAERAAREGVNPRTGKKITIAASKSIRFKAGTKLKAIL